MTDNDNPERKRGTPGRPSPGPETEQTRYGKQRDVCNGDGGANANLSTPTKRGMPRYNNARAQRIAI